MNRSSVPEKVAQGWTVNWVDYSRVRSRCAFNTAVSAVGSGDTRTTSEAAVSALYALLYRLGFTPWERYAKAAAASIGTLLDREEAGRSHPLGRAIDLGCGRGLYTRELAGRGWQVVGINNVPHAINAANRRGIAGATFVVGDVTNLESAQLGTFDFFLDVGCFQGLTSDQRLGEGRGVSALANPGATLLMLAFQRTSVRSLAGGVSREQRSRRHSRTGRCSQSSRRRPPDSGDR
jgi:SAM-dependent methyltransferase